MVDPAKNATSASENLRLRTPRLELIAATLPLIESEVCGPAKLSSLLQAEVETWPPPLNDESSLGWTHEKLKKNPDGAGFFVWYVVSNEHQSRKLVGIVAFKGPPDAEGTIEAGYSILEKHQKRGIGTEATRAIMQWAFRNPAVRQINAETFPELRPSIKVMERCGMTFRGEGSEVGTIRYGVTREEFERREAD